MLKARGLFVFAFVLSAAVGPRRALAQSRLDDCNTDGVSDAQQIASGALPDCNRNRIPDGCELSLPSSNLSFAVTQTIATGFETESVVATYTTYAGAVLPLDFNGDGRTDLLASSEGANKLIVLLNTGGQFATRFLLDVQSQPECAIAADIDNDGDADVIASSEIYDVGCSHTPLGVVGVYRNLGFSQGQWLGFGSRTDIVVGCQPEGMAAADLDANGAVDLAFALEGANAIGILWNDGAGNFTAYSEIVLQSGGLAPQMVAIGDVDANGKPDILTCAISGSAAFRHPSVDIQQSTTPRLTCGRGSGHNQWSRASFSPASLDAA